MFIQGCCCFQVQSYDNLSWKRQALICGWTRPQRISVKTKSLKLIYTRNYDITHNEYLQMKFNATYKIVLPKNAGLFWLIPEYAYNYLLVFESLQLGA